MARKTKVNEGQWGGQWSITKLDSVEKYLEAYLFVMKNVAVRYGWHLLYIDAFSGSGSQHIKKEHVGEIDLEGKEITDFVEGSTMRALAVTERLESNGTRGFEHFDFIDMDQVSLDALRTRVKAEHPTLLGRCQFLNGDSNKLLPELVNRYPWSKIRGVIFIDPYRANFNKTLLEEVASTGSLDVWFLFPLSAIGRMMARKGERISAEWEKKLDDFFGSHDWYDRLYTEKTQASLFDTVDTFATRAEGYDELLVYMKDWLEGIFGKGNVLDPLRLNGSNNSPLFALIAATSSKSKNAINAWKRIARSILTHA